MFDNVESLVAQLPPLSPNVSSLLHTLNDDKSGAQDIEKGLIACPVIAGRVLQMANSSFYGFSREITTLKDASVILGQHTLKNLVYTLAIMDRFQDTIVDEIEGVPLHERIWRHSLYAACLSKVLVGHKSALRESLFASALFQYLGLIVMDYFETERLQVALHNASCNRCSLLNATEYAFGVSYLALTCYVLEYWNFPAEVCDILKNLTKEECTPATDILSVTHISASALGYEIIPGAAPPPIREEWLQSIKENLTHLSDDLLETDEIYAQLSNELIPS